MNGIGGNIAAELQIRFSGTNEIGEAVPVWNTVRTLKGWLDLASGDSKYSTYHAKFQESTHVFICDHEELPENVSSENSRVIVNGKIYDIMLIDNPMELNYQLEIYLKYTGGGNG